MVADAKNKIEAGFSMSNQMSYLLCKSNKNINQMENLHGINLILILKNIFCNIDGRGWIEFISHHFEIIR